MFKTINNALVGFIDRTLYAKFPDQWDNIMFRDMVLPLLKKEHFLLDVGAGRGAMEEMNFRDLVTSAEGIDVDSAIHQNPFLHKAYVYDGGAMHGLTDARFDVVVSNNVLEHVDEPDKFFAEIARVTKPGGIIVTKTPNRWHYMPLFASITPTSFHKFYNLLRGRDYRDTFPTRYRINTRSAQRAMAEKNGLEVTYIKVVEGRPEYLRLAFFVYPFGIIYEKLVNWFGLEDFRIVIFTVFKKK
jgi:2-polyprenyl-3-methyl-5-hydroxy-6-metoxy-1,4-benzoquinol methylase